jgi:hypothetical protein
MEIWSSSPVRTKPPTLHGILEAYLDVLVIMLICSSRSVSHSFGRRTWRASARKKTDSHRSAGDQAQNYCIPFPEMQSATICVRDVQHDGKGAPNSLSCYGKQLKVNQGR